MTYEELLRETAVSKRKAIADLAAALKGPAGFLVKAEIEKDPGKAAWYFLADEFCHKLTEHIDEFIDEGGDTADEAMRIFMAYEDGDADLYEMLPTEARLFDK